MFTYLFKTLELIRYYQNDFDPRIAILLYFANKAAESFEFIADQTSPTSSKELVEPSEIFGVEKCRRRETYSYISDISELFNWPRKLLHYKILVILSCQTLAMIFSHCWQ